MVNAPTASWPSLASLKSTVPPERFKVPIVPTLPVKVAAALTFVVVASYPPAVLTDPPVKLIGVPVIAAAAPSVCMPPENVSVAPVASNVPECVPFPR
jgi:hypothetical protein